MREIKFRAWDTGLEEMFYSDENYFCFKDGKLLERDGRKGTFPEDNIIMQYTGLKDKNGKEIYDGDIITINRPFYYSKSELSTKGIVVINPMGVTAIPKDGKSISHWYQIKKEKIIGNKYENPELLEE